MRSTSDQLLLVLPAILAALLLALCMAPLRVGNLPLTPNVTWLMTLIVARRAPLAWGMGIAFMLGLVQDVLFATPLGSQALVALLLCYGVQRHARRPLPRFMPRWAEAILALAVAHALLWAVMAMTSTTPALAMVFYGTLACALWFPLFDTLFAPLMRLLPAA